MSGRRGVTWVLAVSMFCLSACHRMHDPDKNAASDANLQEITVHVPGMIDRQGIT
jgi:hypothetical protein